MGKYNRVTRSRKLQKLTDKLEDTKSSIKVDLEPQIKSIMKKKAKKAKVVKKAKTPKKTPIKSKKTKEESIKKVAKYIEDKKIIVGIDMAKVGTESYSAIAGEIMDDGEYTANYATTGAPQEPRYMAWSVESMWNDSIGRPDRPIEPRSHLYASELGKAPVDLFLSLNGVKPSNPANDRSKRKFEAGDIWEWILELVLRRAGLLISSQDHIRRCYPGMLEVTGRLDKIAGGKPDWEKARYDIANDFLPDFIKEKAETIINKLSKKYPSGLKVIVIEIKSCSSFMFDTYERSHRASDNHELQAWHYLKDYDEAHVFYVCRDDVRVLELPVFADDKRIEAMYKKHIETITGYWKANEQPPIEKEIIFDELLLKFKDNWRIKYSSYLTMLYGYESQRDYEDRFRPMATRFNRVITRIAEGKTMTKNNLEALAEAKIYYPDFEKHIDEIKKHKDQILAESEEVAGDE